MDNGLDVLKQLMEQNPMAGAAMDGAKKAIRDQAYNAIASGKEDVDKVLGDIVAKFGGVQQAQPVEQEMAQAPQAQPMVQQPVATPEADPLQSAAMKLIEGQDEKLPMMARFQRGALASLGLDPDDVLTGLSGKTKKLANIKTAQEITLAPEKQEMEMALKAAELGTKLQDKTGLKPEHLLNKFEPVANAYQSVVDSYDRVQSSAKDPSPAGDLALIFNYMKILDPNSVVREGEFATAQNSGSIPERLRASYNKVVNGERLSDTMRKDFVDRSDRMFSAKEKQYLTQEEQFKKIAEKNGLDPEKLFRKVRRSPTVDEDKKAAAIAELKRRGKL